MRRKRSAREVLRHMAGFLRTQTEKEEHARLLDHLAALDPAGHRAARGVMAPQPRQAVRALVDDPLERLWRLPAWSRDV